jgi:hypothetical protein
VSGNVTLDTAGGQTVYVGGLNFGPVGGSVVSVVGTYGVSGSTYTASSCVVDVSHVRMACVSAAGVGVGHRWIVSVGGQSSALSDESVFVDYGAPLLRFVYAVGVFLTELPTEGDSSIVLEGFNFGEAVFEGTQVSSGVADGIFLVNCTMITPHTKLGCRSPPWVGTDYALQVVVAGQSSNFADDLIGYDVPVVAALISSVELLDTRGGEVVRLRGSNFGPPELSVQFPVIAEYGSFSAACTVVVPHVEVECVSAEGVGAGHTWVVIVGGQSSAPSTNVTSYRPPVLANVTAPPLLLTEGGEQVVLFGNFFGSGAEIPNVTFQSATSDVVYSATFCAMTTPHTQLTCFSAPGVGASLAWTLMVGGQRSAAVSNATSYFPPSIVALPDSDAMATSGGDRVTISGVNLGPVFDNPITATYGRTGVEYVARDCAVVVPHLLVTCVSIEGSGQGLTWVLHVGNQSTTSPEFVTSSYASPFIASLTPLDGSATDLTPSGGSRVVVNGTNLGPDVFPAPYNIRLETSLFVPSLGTTRTLTYVPTCSFLVAHRSLLCVVGPGAGHSFHWQVTVAQEESPPSVQLTSFAAPRVSQVVAPRLRTPGGDEVLIQGVNFGPPSDNLLEVVQHGPPQAPYFASACVALNDSAIRCVSSPGIGSNHSWQVLVAGQASQPDEVFPLGQRTSYLPPSILELSPRFGPSLGGQLVAVAGANMGNSSLGELFAFAGAAPCVVNASTHVHDRAECMTQPSPPGPVPFVVATGNQTSTPAAFDVYSIGGLTRTFGPYDGGTTLFVQGSNLVEGATYAVLFGQEPAPSVTRVSASLLRVVSPNMTGILYVTSTVSVLVSVGGQVWIPCTDGFTYYMPPEVFSLSPVLGPTSGGTNVTVNGVYFDTDVVNGSFIDAVTGARAAWANCSLLSTTVVECTSPVLPAPGQYVLQVSVETDADSFRRFSQNRVIFHAHGNVLQQQFQFPQIAPTGSSVDFVYQVNVGPLVQWVPVQDLTAMAAFAGQDFVPASASYVQQLRVTESLDTGAEEGGLEPGVAAAAGLPSDVSVIVVLDTASLIAQRTLGTDCRDIEFLSTDGNVKLCHWFPPNSCNSAATRVWVRTPV